MDCRTTRFLSLGILVASVLWGGFAAPPAVAASITYNFAGTVDVVPGALSSQFNTSQTMFGSVTMNDSIPGNGFYQTTAFTLNIGSYQATQGNFGTMTIDNNSPVYHDAFYLNQGVIGPVGSYSPAYFEFDLRGPDTLFNSTALPVTPPSISAFSGFNQWRLVFKSGDAVVGQLTAVPLPAAVVLFGAGLVALVGLGAGSWRPKSGQLVA